MQRNSRKNNFRMTQKEEEKLLYQAIKNSLIETKNVNLSLSDIEEMPVFRPTEEEFNSPMDYIEKLYYKQKANHYGCVKIVPPASFKPQCAFDMNSD